MTTTGRTVPSGRRLTLLAAGALAAAALVAGCGSSGGGSSSSSSSAGHTGNPGQSQGTLMTEHDATLGTLVTDGQGFTLYRFDQDTNSPSASHCTDACATLWPPELANGSGSADLKGIDAKLVSTVTRPDGSHQLTLNGWPLYRYAPDTKPGETKGQGVDGTWFAATPTGDKAMPVSGGMPSTPSGGGY
jgi:predicted lipoprotein with Yx(FWY)xxD motif